MQKHDFNTCDHIIEGWGVGIRMGHKVEAKLQGKTGPHPFTKLSG